MLKEILLDSIDLSKMNCAFVVKNLKTGEITAYNEKMPVSSASLIKIPIMGEVLRQVREGKLSLSQRIQVKKKDKVPFSILTMMDDGNTYTLKDIITLMIVQSDNTAANILIDFAGIEKINAFIMDSGLDGTVLQRKMMDFDGREKGRDNYTTASDMARLMELIYKKELVDADSSLIMSEIMKNQLDNSMMRLFIPDDTVVAHKTGGLDFINHDAGIVFHDKCDYIFCVLVWNAETNNHARYSIGRMSETVYKYFIEK